MKEHRTADFLVTITEEFQQHEAVPERFEGIYTVQCNHHVDVAFVPDFRTEANWPPTSTFADSIEWDAPPDSSAARWTIVMSSNIVVTAHDGAMDVERVDTPKLSAQDEPRTVVMLWIPRELFSTLVDEMRMLLDGDDRIYWRGFGGGGVPISQLEHTEIVQFLREHVLVPMILTPRELHLLALD
jgi:hypothetical protein